MSDQKFHFISGLPRSGSTLLGAILRQNPQFSAGMSSPIAALFCSVVDQVSVGSELSHLVDAEQRKQILRGLFSSFYADNPATTIFDTNRAWTTRTAELVSLFPDAKFICCVRNVAWVMDSLERQFRAKTFENTGLFGNPNERANIYTRTEALASSNRLVGYAYQALQEACWGEFAERIVLVEYDMLATRPADVIALIYEFIGEALYPHCFDDVSFDAPSFDEHLGLDGLHRVRPIIALEERRTVLPPDLFEKYARLAFWQDLQNCAAFRIVGKSDPDN